MSATATTGFTTQCIEAASPTTTGMWRVNSTVHEVMSQFARLRPRLSNASVIFRNAQATRRGQLKEISDKPAAMASGRVRAIPPNARPAGRWAREISNRPLAEIASETGTWALQVAVTGVARRSEE